MALLFRYSSLAALTASALAPLYVAWLSRDRATPDHLAYHDRHGAILICRHRANIRNLLAGTETKIGR